MNCIFLYNNKLKINIYLNNFIFNENNMEPEGVSITTSGSKKNSRTQKKE